MGRGFAWSPDDVGLVEHYLANGVKAPGILKLHPQWPKSSLYKLWGTSHCISTPAFIEPKAKVNSERLTEGTSSKHRLDRDSSIFREKSKKNKQQLEHSAKKPSRRIGTHVI